LQRLFGRSSEDERFLLERQERGRWFSSAVQSLLPGDAIHARAKEGGAAVKFDISVNTQFRQPLVHLQLDDSASGIHISLLLTGGEARNLTQGVSLAMAQMKSESKGKVPA
jgi:hypothetical protein